MLGHGQHIVPGTISGNKSTNVPSFLARRTMGMKMERKSVVSKAKPRAARVCHLLVYKSLLGADHTHNYSVFPGKDGQLIETSDEIPARGDVASDEDADSEDGEGVHRALLPATAHDPFPPGERGQTVECDCTGVAA